MSALRWGRTRRCCSSMLPAHSCAWHTWRGQERREQTLGSSTRFWKTLPTSLSSPGRANPQQHFWMQKVGKKKTNMYREPGSERGVIPIHLFILQILTIRRHSTGLSSHISSFTDPYKQRSEASLCAQTHTDAQEAKRQEEPDVSAARGARSPGASPGSGIHPPLRDPCQPWSPHLPGF